MLIINVSEAPLLHLISKLFSGRVVLPGSRRPKRRSIAARLLPLTACFSLFRAICQQEVKLIDSDRPSDRERTNEGRRSDSDVRAEEVVRPRSASANGTETPTTAGYIANGG